MSLDPTDLTRWGLHGLQAVMLAVVFFAMRWNRWQPGIEIPSMLLLAIAIGGVGNLFQAAARSSGAFYDTWEAWVDLGFLLFVLQALFWISLWQLWKRGREAEPSDPEAADA